MSEETPPGKPPSTHSRLDDLPADAQAHAADPRRQVQHYVLVDKIGKGGTGTVWKAWDRKLTRWVAIKFLLSQEEGVVQRFQREAQLAARLRHPNIAPIYEVGEIPPSPDHPEPRPFLVMEYIDGQPLGARVLPLRETVEVFIKVVLGVEAAHKLGIIHRDLKPANVMLTRDKWPYVMDFGLAKSLQVESTLSMSGAVMGTPAYMAPEQAAGELENIDARSDVYSLGATLYTLVCRETPFGGKNPMDTLMKVLTDTPPRPRERHPEIPEELERIILRAMARDKAERYPTAAAMAEDLQRFLAQLAREEAPTVLTSASRGRPARVWPWLVVGGALAAGLLGISHLVGPGPAPPPAPPPVPPPLEDAWRSEWSALRDRLDVVRWNPADAPLAAQAREHLARMDAEHRTDVATWFELQVRLAQGEAERLKDPAMPLDERRRRGERLARWSAQMGAVAGALEALAVHVPALAAIEKEAAAVAAYRGKFTLLVAVDPFGEVVRLTCDGRPVPVAAPHTPLVLRDLEIGDYEIEIAHPELGKKTVRLGSGALKDGKSYSVTGRMKNPELKVGPSSP